MKKSASISSPFTGTSIPQQTPHTSMRVFSVLSGSALLLFLFAVIDNILFPILSAFSLAYLATPLVDSIELRSGKGRVFATIAVFLLLLGIILLWGMFFLPLLQQQWLGMKELLEFNFEFQFSTQELVATTKPQSLNAGFFYFLLLPSLSFYFLLHWHRLLQASQNLFPQHYRYSIYLFCREWHLLFSHLLRDELPSLLLLSCLYALGFSLLNIQYALLLGLFCGLCLFLPYLGFVIILLSAVTVAWLQLQSMLVLAAVILLIGVGKVFRDVFKQWQLF